MSEQTWTVDVDGRKHTVTVDHDWQSRRATIRVDGRMAVKPMSGEESERAVPVGSTPYVIRRLENDTFDLDIPPEVFLDRAASGAPLGKTRSGSRQVPEERGIGRRIAMIAGGVAPAVFNAANEVAVGAFLGGRIPFLAIPQVVEHTLGAIQNFEPADLPAVIAIDAESRRIASFQLSTFAP